MISKQYHINMEVTMENKKTEIMEKEITKQNGLAMLLFTIFLLFASVGVFVLGCMWASETKVFLGVFCIILGTIAFTVDMILFAGLHIINPNEAIVLTLFGQYYGTIKKEGYYFTNPFAGIVTPSKDHGMTEIEDPSKKTAQVQTVSKKISLKTLTLHNQTQKVNDILGNPIIIGAVVIWKVQDPTKAIFEVDNYKTFLSIQCDSTIRNIARLYPYDTMEEDSEEKTLRGSSIEIAESMRIELQERVQEAGLYVEEVRITHLSYAEEIAAAMLQRQQAVAVIAARQKIVEGAVSMVKMAIDQLGEEEVVVLDEERKAAMVSNLLVVLCGNKDAQPVINNGSIY